MHNLSERAVMYMEDKTGNRHGVVQGFLKYMAAVVTVKILCGVTLWSRETNFIGKCYIYSSRKCMWRTAQKSFNLQNCS